MYRVVAVISSGSFGTVVAARRTTDRSLVALKVLREMVTDDPRLTHRARDEARLLSILHHPHIVRVEGLEEIGGRLVVVMELVRGAALDAVIESQPDGIATAEAVSLVIPLARALHGAWSMEVDGRPLRVIHRDLKPSNALIDLQGVVKLVDFGTARGDFEGREAETVSMVLGSRGYLAPERLDGASDEPSGDVYALGLTLYELLVGTAPELSLHPVHHQSGVEQALAALDQHRPGPLVGPVGEVLRAMLAYRASERPSAEEVLQALEELVPDAGPRAKAFAARAVPPILGRRSRTPPRDHALWPEVAFLEAGVGPSPVHLQALQGAMAPWWRSFGRGPDTKALLEALDALPGVPAKEHQPLVEALRSHPDRSVAERATLILQDVDGSSTWGRRTGAPSRP